jgi:aryl-alcohol dehydrogenase-like predicted oxidoreductase
VTDTGLTGNRARRRLGSTDIEITPVGLGCMQFAGGGFLSRQMFPAAEQPTVTEIVKTALDGGVSWFDTAEMYGHGHSERMLATALRELGASPPDTTIATKWTPLLRTSASIARTFGSRLGALTGYPVTLHQIHLPHGSLSPVSRQLDAMAGLRETGQIKAIGVSNFNGRQLAAAHAHLAARGIPLASDQVQVSLAHRAIEHDGTLEAARRLGVTLIASSPLRSGLLTGKFHERPELAAAAPRIRRAVGGLTRKELARTEPLIRELRQIAEAYGVSPSVVALSWVISFYGDTVVAIPGASRPAHARDSAAAMDLRLTGRELARLDEVSRTAGHSG